LRGIINNYYWQGFELRMKGDNNNSEYLSIRRFKSLPPHSLFYIY
jgi:hypothetical protein